MATTNIKPSGAQGFQPYVPASETRPELTFRAIVRNASILGSSNVVSALLRTGTMKPVLAISLTIAASMTGELPVSTSRASDRQRPRRPQNLAVKRPRSA